MNDVTIVVVALIAGIAYCVGAYLEWKLSIYKEQCQLQSNANFLTVLHKAVSFDDDKPTVH